MQAASAMTSSFGTPTAVPAASPRITTAVGSSATVGEGIPPAQSSRTTQLNMSMIESKVRKLEDELTYRQNELTRKAEQHETQVRREVGEVEDRRAEVDR